jgi:hydroxybutyrate-dimer hydrolase
MPRYVWTAIAWVVALATGPAFANGNPLPPLIVKDSIQRTEYDGINDDLLSAGLNLEGLQGAAANPPPVSTPPTVAELRRLAIYSNYRGISDPVPAGGMGVLWGPKSEGAPDFGPEVTDGLIPGVEYLAFLKIAGNRGHQNRVTLMVQIPRNFDSGKGCILAVAPSGSRGIYGAISVAEWGFFNGCAVVHADKGTGTGFHLLGDDMVYDINGIAATADVLGDAAQFAVRKGRTLRDFLEDKPYRVATKHAHSQIHPETRWGEFVLHGLEFALWALNEEFPDQQHTPENTLVIAGAVSNGAGAVLRAAEADRPGRNKLIDGLVVTEPNINPDAGGGVTIRFGDETFPALGNTLYDDVTAMALYADCASLWEGLAGMPLFGLEPVGAPASARANRCASLHEVGLLEAEALQDQPFEALQKLRAIGYAEELDWGIPFHAFINVWRSLNPTYAAAYGRLAVWDNVCDVSFAYTDPASNQPAPVPPAVAETLFATSAGIPATGGINLIADAATQGPIVETLAISPSTGRQDLNLESALCFRYLSTGVADGLPDGASREMRTWHRRVERGARDVKTTADLNGTPAIIIHGRQDALVFPDSHSRPYYALNQLVEGEDSNLSYIEVTPGQHWDAFISTLLVDPADGGTQWAPLHFYLTRGLDMMLAHLLSDAPLPPSQVVRASARGTSAYTLADVGARLPLPALDPGDDAITFDPARRTLFIPKE